jgi:hypothetical protein
MSHVSCAPSSNRTDGFPVSGSSIIFSRWLAPQSFQVTHFAHHLVQPTSVMEEVIPPSFPGGPPGTLVLTPKPQLELAPDGPVHFMKCPVAVADPEIVELLRARRLPDTFSIPKLCTKLEPDPQRVQDGGHYCSITTSDTISCACREVSMQSLRFNLIITSSALDDNRQVTIQIPLSCLGISGEKGFYRQWFIADDAKNAVFSSIFDPGKAQQINAQIDVACAATPWKSVMTDVELTLNELGKLGFNQLADLAEQRG